MGLKKFANITPAELKSKGVVSLADKPNASASYGVGGLSPTQLKLWFDQLSKLLADKINAIQNVLSGENAAEYVRIVLTELEGEYSLQDLCNMFGNGNFAEYLQAYGSAKSTSLQSLQSIINAFDQAISVMKEDLSDSSDKAETAYKKSIKSINVTYQEGDNGNVLPDGNWTSAVPVVHQGKYLWTRTIITLNDESSSTAYSVSRMGEKGEVAYTFSMSNGDLIQLGEGAEYKNLGRVKGSLWHVGVASDNEAINAELALKEIIPLIGDIFMNINGDVFEFTSERIWEKKANLKGDKGDGFRISKTYSSVDEMNSEYNTDNVPLYGFVIIDTGNVEDEENARLYMKAEDGYRFLTDMSGAQGIKGEQGPQGEHGLQGATGKEALFCKTVFTSELGWNKTTNLSMSMFSRQPVVGDYTVGYWSSPSTSESGVMFFRVEDIDGDDVTVLQINSIYTTGAQGPQGEQGPPGERGAAAPNPLIYKGELSIGDPKVGSTMGYAYAQINEEFSRIPSLGDYFVQYWRNVDSTTLYIVLCRITECATTQTAGLYSVQNFSSIALPVGPQGDRGITFTPSIDTDGNLSWTNDGSLINPLTVNLRGPKGDPGPKGESGLTAEQIEAFSFLAANMQVVNGKVKFSVEIEAPSFNAETT